MAGSFQIIDTLGGPTAMVAAKGCFGHLNVNLIFSFSSTRNYSKGLRKLFSSFFKERFIFL